VTDDTPAGKDEAAPTEQTAAASVGGDDASDEPAVASADEDDTPAAEDVAATDGPTVAADEPATVDAPIAPAPVASTTAAAPPPRERRGVFVPVWLAALLAVLLVGGIGFAIGYASADGNDSNSTSAAAVQPDRNSNDSNGSSSGSDNSNRDNDNDADNDNSGTRAAPTAFLGVSIEGVENGGGAEINNVQPGSPAADAGLRSGDVVTKVGDVTVEDAADLIRAVRSHEPGDEVTITYTRDGRSSDVQVELGESDVRNSLPS
jgi:putative serine protease PepD